MLITLFQEWEPLIEWTESEGMAEDLTDGWWKDKMSIVSLTLNRFLTKGGKNDD